MVDYAKTQSKVSTKLGKVGMALTIKIANTTASSYDVTTDLFDREIVQSYSVHGIKRAYTDKEITSGFLGQEKSKNLIQVGDVEFMISVSSDLPTLNDEQDITVVEGEVEWKAIRVKTVAPGGVVLFYKLHTMRRDKT